MKKSEEKHKKFHVKRFIKRVLIVLAAVAVLILIFIFMIWLIFGRSKLTEPEDIKWGVTYSPLAVEDLKLDPDETYRAIIEDLRPNKIRLVAYWNRIEKQPGEYDFSDLKKQVEIADSNNIPIVIAVGRRVPRYPECHAPEWSETLPQGEQNKKILELIERTIGEFDQYQNVVGWQIENEPFLGSFGICPPLDEQFLAQEIDLARSLTNKTILTTESGELSLWLKASKYPDVMGTTLYRTVLVSGTDIAVNHVYPSWYYRARSNIVKSINDNIESVIVAELQGEPWTTKGIINSTQEDINRTMSHNQFNKNIDFTERVGFPEVYWWGVEWWYYEKLKGEPFYWDRAGELFR
jgi:hypothetical protein